MKRGRLERSRGRRMRTRSRGKIGINEVKEKENGGIGKDVVEEGG